MTPAVRYMIETKRSDVRVWIFFFCLFVFFLTFGTGMCNFEVSKNPFQMFPKNGTFGSHLNGCLMSNKDSRNLC